MGQSTTMRARIALRAPGPRAAEMPTARTSAGKARNMSVILMTTSSTTPPRYPARAPRRLPTTKATETTATETVASNGIATRTCLKMFRPKLSVPKKLSSEGGRRELGLLNWNGSYPTKLGTMPTTIAIAKNTATMTRPTPVAELDLKSPRMTSDCLVLRFSALDLEQRTIDRQLDLRRLLL